MGSVLTLVVAAFVCFLCGLVGFFFGYLTHDYMRTRSYSAVKSGSGTVIRKMHLEAEETPESHKPFSAVISPSQAARHSLDDLEDTGVTHKATR